MTAAESPPHDPESDIDPFGRVGYGRLARYSPLILGAAIAAAVVVIAFNQEDDGPATRSLIGQSAPELLLTPFDGGQPYPLSSLRGDVVVLNFWAAWCEPCKAEMPAFQAVHAEATDGLSIIGIDIKSDRVDDARALIEETGVTYPLVRDNGGDH